jgi:hypothetical protein
MRRALPAHSVPAREHAALTVYTVQWR